MSVSISSKFWSFLEDFFEILEMGFCLIVVLGFFGSIVGIVHYVIFWSLVGMVWRYLSGDITLFTNMQDDSNFSVPLTTVFGMIAIVVAFLVDSHLQFDKNDEHHEIKGAFVFVGTLTALSVLWRVSEYVFS